MTFHLHVQHAPDLPRLISPLFEAFTLLPGIGYWQGQPENTVTIEITTPDRAKIDLLARRLAQALNQDAVLVEEIPTTARLIRPIADLPPSWHHPALPLVPRTTKGA
jgi:hypothetical protein